MSKYLYIPMEIFDRELDGNLMLSIAAVMRGWTVILGGKTDILWRIGSLPRGVYLLKSIVPGETHIQNQIHATGGRVACLDQEGLLQRWGLEYRFRFSRESLSKTDILFFWGREQLKHFQEMFPRQPADKLLVSGSPRLDFWALIGRNKKYFAEYYERKYGRSAPDEYVLFTTSFGNANHILGDVGRANLLKGASGIRQLDEEEEKILLANAESRRELAMLMINIYRDFLLLLSSTHPEIKIVLRPHPSEGIEFWKSVIADRENISIETSGATTDWIVRARCVIQYGSTVAIESAMLGVPVVTCIPPLPNHLKALNLHYPQVVSHVATSVEDAVKTVSGVLSNREQQEIASLSALQDITNSDVGFNSSDRILSSLEKFSIDTDCAVRVGRIGIRNISRLVSQAKRIALAIALLIPGVSKFVPDLYRHLTVRDLYKQRKVYKLSTAKLEERMDLIRNIEGLNHEPIAIDRISGNLFKITKRT